MYDNKSSYAVIGVDPGLMTGIFVFMHMHHDGGGYIPPKTDLIAKPYQVPAHEVGTWLWETIDWLEDTDQGPGPGDIHIAVEKYIITSRTAKLTQQHEALEVTGAVKAVALQSFSKPEVKQYLKSNLKYASDDILRTMGWFTPKLRHANDAARQASALLKEVDYPRWCELVKGGTLDTTTNEEMTG